MPKKTQEPPRTDKADFEADRQEGGDASRGGEDAFVARGAGELQRLAAKPLATGLYIVATPIGNLGDITLRALATLARADAILCEDTRHSRNLLKHFAIAKPLRPYHEHNAARERPKILAELTEGKALALISDAGTPLISDPGYKLVREVAAAGHDVIALPGPSALLAALASAGLPTDSFFFAGFLPSKQQARKNRLEELTKVPATLVFYEAPSRLAASLADIAAAMGERQAVVARELTKLHEEVKRGTPEELVAWASKTALKGEMVVLVGPPQAKKVSDDIILERLTSCLQTMSLRDAAKFLAADLHIAKSRVYNLGLSLKTS